jgi:TldD protein
MEDLAQSICDRAKRRGATFADVRIVHRRGESILVQDGRADKLAASSDRGIGVRVLVGRCWGFASADSLLKRRAERCLSDALALARASEAFVSDPAMIAEAQAVQAEDRSTPEIPPGAVPVKEKMARLLEYERVGGPPAAAPSSTPSSVTPTASARRSWPTPPGRSCAPPSRARSSRA